jgi:pyruvate, water dikinase
MKRAAAIVTDHGGRTSHAAIVSRELGLPAIVGTGNATQCCTTGRRSRSPAPRATRASSTRASASSRSRRLDLDDLPRPAPQVMLNLANPAAAFRWWRLPADGVGLARMEFVISNASRSTRWRWSISTS